MPPLAEKVDNLELISVGIQHDLMVVTGAVNKLEKKLANLSTSDEVEKISKSFQTSLERIKKMVTTISSSPTNGIPNKQENTDNNDIRGQREKRNKQTQEDEMTDEDDEVIVQPLKFSRWQTLVEKIAKAMMMSAQQASNDGNDDQNKSHPITPVHQNP
jgi:Asp-tRNA(Asn)/Glu-tRNA(Gln) amidotransferase C subunit